jgi:hypothetical protein
MYAYFFNLEERSTCLKLLDTSLKKILFGASNFFIAQPADLSCQAIFGTHYRQQITQSELQQQKKMVFTM